MWCWWILDYKNCKYRKKSVAPSTDKCIKTVEEVKLAKITLTKNENSNKCTPCTVYIVLMIVVCTICAGISAYFVYYNWSLFCALNLAPVFKQQFTKHINEKSQTN